MEQHEAMKFSLVQAELAINAGPQGKIGAMRVALLEAIRDHGSISAGAKATGIGFRAAWDAVTTLNNLFPTPLVLARAGGKDGGRAGLTEAGHALVRGFRAVESALGQVARDSGAGLDQPTLEQFWRSVNMRTSARNNLAGIVTSVDHGGVDCEVVLRVSDQVEIVAVITDRSARELDLRPGSRAVALIKSSFVILAPYGNGGRTSARNRLSGTITGRQDTAVNSEIIMDLGNGKSLTAIVTRTSADELALQVGSRACALIKAPHVILAVP